MYEITPALQRSQRGHTSTSYYDDDYDVYLLWHTTRPWVILPTESVDPNEVALIPNWHLDNQYERLAHSRPPSITYSFDSDFVFPAREDDRESRFSQTFAAGANMLATFKDLLRKVWWRIRNGRGQVKY